MRAMILAAGLGTRLRPLTLVRPKVLVPVMGTSVLDFWIWQLYHAGFESVVVNAFQLHEHLALKVKEEKWPIPVEIRKEPTLLGTGGGIRNVLDFFGSEPFAVINGDIICRLPLRDLYQQHLDSGSAASLLMHDCPPFNNVAVNREGMIVGFGEEAKRFQSESSDVRIHAFTGVHFICPKILKDLPAGRSGDILTVYRRLIQEDRLPRSLYSKDLFWREMGSLDAYRDLHSELHQMEENFLHPIQTGKRTWVHPEAWVASDAHLRGFVAVGKGSRVLQGVELENTILWDRVLVEPGAKLFNCIVADGVTVAGKHADEVLVRGE